MRRTKKTLFGTIIIPLILLLVIIIALVAYDNPTNSFKIFGLEYNLDNIHETKKDTSIQKNSIPFDVADEIIDETTTYEDDQLNKVYESIKNGDVTVIMNDSVIYEKKIIN